MQQLYQDHVDLMIMKLICVCGVIPKVIDSPEWKALMNLLNSVYNPHPLTHSMTNIYPMKLSMFARSRLKFFISWAIWHWPLMTTLSESSKVQCTQPMPLLQTERHSFLMVTWAVVMNVKQLSGLRRSYWRYVFHIALGTWLTCSQTVRSVGELQWAATCSDSTNVTKAVCWEIIKEIVTMLNLNDYIHHLHNTVGDINKIIMFK